MSYVRVCRNLNSQGDLVPAEEVDEFIKAQADYAKDAWFMGTFSYPEQALEYFKSNGDSMKGYTGEARTNLLYWDLDGPDLNKVKDQALSLTVYLLETFDCEANLELYFSGNKGFHVLLHSEEALTPDQVRRVTSKIARQAGAAESYDSSVYNSTRIFRYPNTLHQKSGLWKIPLSPEELTLPAEKIKKLASSPRTLEQAKVHPSLPMDATELLKQFDYEEQFTVSDEDAGPQVSILQEFSDLTGEAPFERQCIAILQAGNFGPGERENALIRMAAYYKNCHLSFEQVLDKLNQALESRATKYDNLNPHADADTLKVVKQVFDPGWRGGMFSCKTDLFLIDKCSQGGNCCMAPKPAKKNHDSDFQFGIGGLLKEYIKLGEEADKEFPRTGLANLDRYVRLRRQNISIVAGAPGSGKTSLILEIMESLNRQKINHFLFSLDMAAPSLLEMLAVRYTNYSVSQIESAFSAKTRDRDLMREIGQRLKEELPHTYIDVSTAVDLNHVERTVKDWNEKLDEPIQICFVDYASRLMGSGDSSYQKASANALRANDVAKSTNTHMMFIAQISRESGDHTTPLHSNRVSKDSSEWEANATVVMSVWRPFGTGIDADDKYMHIYIAKNRSGSAKELYFNWNGAKRKIRPLEPEELTEYATICQEHNKPLPSLRDLEWAEEQDKAYQSRTKKRVDTSELDRQSPETIKNHAREQLTNANTDNLQKGLQARTGFKLPPASTRRN